MVEEGIRGGISQVLHDNVKANNKYMKNYDESKDSSFLEYQDANNLYGYPVTQKLPVRDFKSVKSLPKINEDYIKTMIKIVIKDIFLK